jgi:hypothetical protein
LRWALAFGHHEDRTPTHGYAATREAAMGGVRKKLAAGSDSRRNGILWAKSERRERAFGETMVSV